ncbi:hypothetical protein EXIGLDRAFT_750482 [Exidia glandulosa HHB12029]|uniref:Uncharacterized protein n=1 Tax=Exidia glandulosa HHB12029 TaxID=1314781 RepID=A0A165GN34_EXIGL|nr:hypothetical protein EXIGLDRAFT_750482 [Exidia glandulosa HHB12029]
MPFTDYVRTSLARPVLLDVLAFSLLALSFSSLSPTRFRVTLEHLHRYILPAPAPPPAQPLAAEEEEEEDVDALVKKLEHLVRVAPPDDERRPHLERALDSLQSLHQPKPAGHECLSPRLLGLGQLIAHSNTPATSPLFLGRHSHSPHVGSPLILGSPLRPTLQPLDAVLDHVEQEESEIDLSTASSSSLLLTLHDEQQSTTSTSTSASTPPIHARKPSLDPAPSRPLEPEEEPEPEDEPEQDAPTTFLRALLLSPRHERPSPQFSIPMRPSPTHRATTSVPILPPLLRERALSVPVFTTERTAMHERHAQGSFEPAASLPAAPEAYWDDEKDVFTARPTAVAESTPRENPAHSVQRDGELPAALGDEEDTFLARPPPVSALASVADALSFQPSPPPSSVPPVPEFVTFAQESSLPAVPEPYSDDEDNDLAVAHAVEFIPPTVPTRLDAPSSFAAEQDELLEPAAAPSPLLVFEEPVVNAPTSLETHGDVLVSSPPSMGLPAAPDAEDAALSDAHDNVDAEEPISSELELQFVSAPKPARLSVPAALLEALYPPPALEEDERKAEDVEDVSSPPLVSEGFALALADAHDADELEPHDLVSEVYTVEEHPVEDAHAIEDQELVVSTPEPHDVVPEGYALAEEPMEDTTVSAPVDEHDDLAVSTYIDDDRELATSPVVDADADSPLAPSPSSSTSGQSEAADMLPPLTHFPPLLRNLSVSTSAATSSVSGPASAALSSPPTSPADSEDGEDGEEEQMLSPMTFAPPSPVVGGGEKKRSSTFGEVDVENEELREGMPAFPIFGPRSPVESPAEYQEEEEEEEEEGMVEHEEEDSPVQERDEEVEEEEEEGELPVTPLEEMQELAPEEEEDEQAHSLAELDAQLSQPQEGEVVVPILLADDEPEDAHVEVDVETELAPESEEEPILAELDVEDDALPASDAGSQSQDDTQAAEPLLDALPTALDEELDAQVELDDFDFHVLAPVVEDEEDGSAVDGVYVALPPSPFATEFAPARTSSPGPLVLDTDLHEGQELEIVSPSPIHSEPSPVTPDVRDILRPSSPVPPSPPAVPLDAILDIAAAHSNFALPAIIPTSFEDFSLMALDTGAAPIEIREEPPTAQSTPLRETRPLPSLDDIFSTRPSLDADDAALPMPVRPSLDALVGPDDSASQVETFFSTERQAARDAAVASLQSALTVVREVRKRASAQSLARLSASPPTSAGSAQTSFEVSVTHDEEDEDAEDERPKLRKKSSKFFREEESSDASGDPDVDAYAPPPPAPSFVQDDPFPTSISAPSSSRPSHNRTPSNKSSRRSLGSRRSSSALLTVPSAAPFPNTEGGTDESDVEPLSLDQILDEVFPSASPEIHPSTSASKTLERVPSFEWARPGSAQDEVESWRDSVRFPSAAAAGTSRENLNLGRGRTKSGKFVSRVVEGLQKLHLPVGNASANASTVSLAPSSLRSRESPSSSTSGKRGKESKTQRSRTVSLFSTLSSRRTAMTTPEPTFEDEQPGVKRSRTVSLFSSKKDKGKAKAGTEEPAQAQADRRRSLSMFKRRSRTIQKEEIPPVPPIPPPMSHSHSAPSALTMSTVTPEKAGRRHRTLSVFSTLSSRSHVQRYDDSGVDEHGNLTSHASFDGGRPQASRAGSSAASSFKHPPMPEGTVSWTDLIKPHPQVRSRSPSPIRASASPSRARSLSPNRRMSISNVAHHPPTFHELPARPSLASVRRRTMSAGAGTLGSKRSVSWTGIPSAQSSPAHAQADVTAHKRARTMSAAFAPPGPSPVQEEHSPSAQQIVHSTEVESMHVKPRGRHERGLVQYLTQTKKRDSAVSLSVQRPSSDASTSEMGTRASSRQDGEDETLKAKKLERGRVRTRIASLLRSGGGGGKKL